MNRTPTRSLGWRTPFEVANQKKPSIAHMQPYGCRAYTLRTKVARSDKLSERALVGYLVGYDSTNVYRIWIPGQNKVVRSRDVTFRDDLFYKPDDSSDPLLTGSELAEALEMFAEPEDDISDLSDDQVEEPQREPPRPAKQRHLLPPTQAATESTIL